MHGKTWDDFYDGTDASMRHFLGEIVVHHPYIEAIWEYSPKRTLEVGCGTGRTSILLSQFGISATCLDRDPGMLARAAKIAEALNGNINLVEADAFKLPFPDSSFDVCLHQGLLEHFSDEQIRELISEQLRVAGHVVFSVPGKHYPEQEFGDERLLSSGVWKEILAPFKIAMRCEYYLPEKIGFWANLRESRPIMLMVCIDR